MGASSVSVAILAAAAPALAARAGLSAASLAAPAAPASATPVAAAPVAADPAAAEKPRVLRTAAPVEAAPVPAFPISVTADELLIGQEKKGVPIGAAFTDIAQATERVRSDAEATYAQVRRQGQGWYRLSIISASVGFAIIALAVVALLLGYTRTGLVTTVSSIVPNAIAGLFFAQARQADRRMDASGGNLRELREKYELMQMANTIDDPLVRNALKAEIVRKFASSLTGK